MRTATHDYIEALESYSRLRNIYKFTENISDGTTIETGYFNVKKYKYLNLNAHTDATLNITIEWSPDENNKVVTETITFEPGNYDGHHLNNYCLYVKLKTDNSSGANASDVLINLVGVR